jgi:purine-binding chemotaxis protein CheW
MEESNQYCTFMVDGLFCGVDVTRVQEVLRYQDMTCVPLAPPVVTGLINLRGQIVTAIDMRKRMALNERDEDKLPMNVIVHSADGAALSLLVDEIGDVLEVDEEDAEAPPATLRGIVRNLITKTYKLEGKLLLIIDTEKAIDITKKPDAA